MALVNNEKFPNLPEQVRHFLSDVLKERLAGIMANDKETYDFYIKCCFPLRFSSESPVYPITNNSNKEEVENNKDRLRKLVNVGLLNFVDGVSKISIPTKSREELKSNIKEEIEEIVLRDKKPKKVEKEEKIDWDFDDDDEKEEFDFTPPLHRKLSKKDDAFNYHSKDDQTPKIPGQGLIGIDLTQRLDLLVQFNEKKNGLITFKEAIEWLFEKNKSDQDLELIALHGLIDCELIKMDKATETLELTQSGWERWIWWLEQRKIT